MNSNKAYPMYLSLLDIDYILEALDCLSNEKANQRMRSDTERINALRYRIEYDYMSADRDSQERNLNA